MTSFKVMTMQDPDGSFVTTSGKSISPSTEIISRPEIELEEKMTLVEQ